MSQDISGFFAGGGKTAKFPKVGSEVDGTVTMVHPPELQTDFESRKPIDGKYQIRIEMDVPADPDIDGDDGKRTLYVKGWMTGAIREALQKANIAEPEIGGRLRVVRIEDGPPTRPGLQGPHRYSAFYSSPGIFKATGNGEAQGSMGAAIVAAAEEPKAPIPTEPPAGIDAQAWADMPLPAKQAIANTMAGLNK